jgi:hypothetical protein
MMLEMLYMWANIEDLFAYYLIIFKEQLLLKAKVKCMKTIIQSLGGKMDVCFGKVLYHV